MSNDRERFEKALARTDACQDVEQLGRFAAGTLEAAERSGMEQHVASCCHCQAELAMLREFAAPEVRTDERAAVEWIADRLQHRANEIAPDRDEPRPWWKNIFATPALGRAALVLGSLLVLISGGLYLRQSSAPSLNIDSGSAEVTRSNDVSLLAPRGDLRSLPASFSWQAYPSATRYRVRVMEVDRSELWKSETTLTTIALPDSLRTRIVPAKTLLWQVTAVDGSGQQIGISNPEKFRLSPQSPAP